MGGQLLTRRTRRFAGCFALLRESFACFAQGITHILQTFFAMFRGRFADVSRVTQVVTYTGKACFAMFRGRYAALRVWFHAGRNACFAHVTRTLRGHNAS